MAGKETRKIHPVIRALENSESLLAVLQEGAAGGEPLVKTMLAMREALGSNRDLDQALDLARTIDREPGDLDLKIIFYSLWSTIALRRNLLAEGSTVTLRSLELASQSNCDLTIVMARAARARQVAASGNFDEAERLMSSLQGHLPRGSTSSMRYLGDYASLLAIRGRGVEIRAELERYPDSEPLGEMRPYIDLAHSVETGKFGEAVKPLAVCESVLQKRQVGIPPEGVASYRSTVRALNGLPGGDEDPDGKTLLALLDGKAEDALHWAREKVKEKASFLYETGFECFNLVRAELATGQGEAARRVIALRRERGNTHYLDDLFLARAEMLAGREDAAAAAFARAVEACRIYDALERLELELRLALELSPGGLARMSRVAYREPRSGDHGKVAGVSRSVQNYIDVGPAPAGAELHGAERLIGRSSALQQIRENIRQLAPAEIPILISGETGTGKELVARALHEESSRSDKPFLAVNCAAISEGLLESELFGHARGAFTGATRDHKGIFESAGAGTVFLDEIGEISGRLQTSLLRFLESGEFRPVGASRSRRARCRVVAATNKRLEEMVAAETFRRDLYYRLRGAEIRIPALRERPADIVPLAGWFLTCGRTDGHRPALSEQLKLKLQSRDWHGNIRELRNEMELLRLMSSDKLSYDLEDLRSIERRKISGSRSKSQPAEELSTGNSAMRKLDRVRKMFAEHGKLTRVKIAAEMGVAPDTVTRYLRQLIEAGEIVKVTPNAAPRSHYFEKVNI